MNKYKATLEYYGENKPANLIVHPDNLLLPVDVEFVVKIAGGGRLELDRPRGEWIVIHNALGETKYQCNQCRHYVKPSDDKNFCPNCGSDNRKSGETE